MVKEVQDAAALKPGILPLIEALHDLGGNGREAHLMVKRWRGH